jgi:putative component of membrane protein insertase Oxa1/YidC/SpoIIIJ protein YidD
MEHTAGPLFAVIDHTLAGISLIALDLYRRFVSPYKGYACAYRLRFGGESCSGFARRILATEGWSAGQRAVRNRLRECHMASLALRHERNADQRLADGRGDLFDDQLDTVLRAEDKKVDESLEEACEKQGCACLGGCGGQGLLAILSGMLSNLFS